MPVLDVCRFRFFGFRRILFVAMDTRRGRLRQDLVRVREVERWKILRKPRKRTQKPRYNDLKWCSFPISMGGFLRWICICWKWMFFSTNPLAEDLGAPNIAPSSPISPFIAPSMSMISYHFCRIWRMHRWLRGKKKNKHGLFWRKIQ